MINQLQNRMANFIAGNDNQPIQYQPSGLTSNNMFADIMRTNQTYADIANSIKDISAKYNKDMTAFSDKYEGLMNDLLAKKNKYTGNIFKDFLTDYKDARESGVGLGFRANMLDMLGKDSIPTKALMSNEQYPVGKFTVMPNSENTQFDYQDPTTFPKLSFPKGYGRQQWLHFGMK